MSDVVARAKAALEGVTPGPWEHRTAPHEDDDATHAEWLAGTLIGEGEALHVLIAESTEPRFAYIVPAVTGDGPTSNVNAEFVAAARSLVPALVAEVERLHSWDGLMSLLNEHYPESIFPTVEDREDRDSGPRIVSLIRRINDLEAALSASESYLAREVSENNRLRALPTKGEKP